MQQFWQTMADKFTLLSMRERLLIVLSFVFVIIYAIYSLVLDPAYQQNRQLASQLASLTQQQQQLSFDKMDMQQVLESDPNKEIKLRISRAEMEINMANNKLTALTADLISSRQMALVLGEVLSHAKHVKLLAIESLPVTRLTGHSENKNTPPITNHVSSTVAVNLGITQLSNENTNLTSDAEVLLYRHGLRITLTGTFFNILAYLDTIEKLPQKFYWQVFDYQMQKYPTAKVVMEIYTLSVNKEFIRG